MLKRSPLVKAHPYASLRERNALGFAGNAPRHETLMGLTVDIEHAGAAQWLGKLERSEAGTE